MLRSNNTSEQHHGLARLVEKVTVQSKTVAVRFKAGQDEPPVAPLTIPYQFLTVGPGSRIMTTGDRVPPEIAAQRQTLLKALVRGFVWRKALLEMPDMTVARLAKKEGVNGTYLINLINLTFLAPDLIEIILGNCQHNLVLQRLIFGFPINWKKQLAKVS